VIRTLIEAETLGGFMNKPTWIKVVGILGIIFGCFGIWGSLNIMIMPQIIDFQKEFIGAAMDEARNDPEFPDRLADVMESLWDLPDWFGTWAILFGIAGLLVTGFYLLASIWLLQVKPAADKLMIAALLISIILALIQAITAGLAGGFVAIVFVMGGVFSIIIDLVLLIVILTADRKIFSRDPAMAGVS